jgi:predicted GIY-YIG superfamily endonuclease
MSFYAYMLRCSDGSYYIGHTDSLERRIAQHERVELPGYTHNGRPLTLMWSQDFPSRIEALEAERQLKGWSRAKKKRWRRAIGMRCSYSHANPSIRVFGFAQPLLRTNGVGRMSGMS